MTQGRKNEMTQTSDTMMVGKKYWSKGKIGGKERKLCMGSNFS